MKFTDSPVIDLPVRNAHLSLHQDNGSFEVGTSVWPCSLVLVKFVDRWLPLTCAAHPNPNSNPNPNPYAPLLSTLPSIRAVELGAGCGAAGMGLHLLGLRELVLTDIPAVMPALRHNLKRNKPVLGKTLKTAVVHWNKPDQINALKPPFDLVVAADVVYIEKDVAPLLSAMGSLVSGSGAVLLGYQVRSPEAHRLFWELCANTFAVEKVPHEHLHPDYAFEETDVYILRKKCQ